MHQKRLGTILSPTRNETNGF